MAVAAGVASLAASFDEHRHYFGDDDDEPPSPRSLRAAHVQLMREWASDAPKAEELAALRQQLLLGSRSDGGSGGASSSSSSARPEARAAALDAWVATHLGARGTALRLERFDATGRGLACGPSGLASGEAALRVPEECLLTSRAFTDAFPLAGPEPEPLTRPSRNRMRQ